MAPRVMVAQLSICGKQVPPGAGGRLVAEGPLWAESSANEPCSPTWTFELPWQPQDRCQGHGNHPPCAKLGLTQPAKRAADNANPRRRRIRNLAITFLFGLGSCSLIGPGSPSATYGYLAAAGVT